MTLNKKEVEEFAGQYCETILKYEIYLNRLSLYNSDNFKYKTKIEKQMAMAVNKMMEQDTMPWRFEKGSLKDKISDLILNNDKLFFHFLKSHDAIYDDLSEEIEKFLTNTLYKKSLNNESEVTKDTILNLTTALLESEELDPKVFGEEISELHKIYKSFDELVDKYSLLTKEKCNDDININC